MSTLPPEILAALESAAALQDAGDYPAAERAYWQVLGQNSHVADAWNLLGLMAHELGRPDVARVYIHRAIELDAATGYFHNAMGRTLLALNLREEAVGALKLAAKLDPADPDAWNNLGAALHDTDRAELAVESLNHALSLRPDNAATYSNLCSAHRTLGNLDASIEAGLRSVALKPDWADGHWNLSLALLTAGRWREGWEHFEHRWQCSKFTSIKRKTDCHQWTGEEDVRGKYVVVWGEQGAGDTIQFARYIRRLRERGAHVSLSVSDPLNRLLLPLVDGAEATNEEYFYDYHIPVISLPLALGDVEPIWDGPYVGPPNCIDDASWLRTQPDAGVRVGLCWQGNPNYSNDRNRSIPVEALEQLRSEGVAFYNLQHGVAAPLWTIDLMGECKDFADTAALIANLDLVITVDTSVAHLAGAMGKPVWIVMPERGADWRWGLTGETTAWYPSARIFRGGRDAMGRVADELRALAYRGEPVLSL